MATIMMQFRVTLVSAKTLSEETEIGEDSFQSKVSMHTVEQYDEKKIISKSFIVKKKKTNECSHF
jgi:DNA sulfur modification protein DndD